MKFRAWAGFCQQGVRPRQEDFCIPAFSNTGQPPVFAVCDGVGGGPCGDRASEAAAKAVEAFFEARQNLYADEWPQLADAITQSLRAVSFHHPECAGLASTVAGVVALGGEVWAFWCGDSRIYQLRKGQIIWQSTDQNLKEDFAHKGLAVPSGMNASALQYVASDRPQTQRLQKVLLDMQSGDRLLLCTDGMHGYVPQEQWLPALDSTFTCQEATDQIEKMCAALSRDNFSVWVLDAGIES